MPAFCIWGLELLGWGLICQALTPSPSPALRARGDHHRHIERCWFAPLARKAGEGPGERARRINPQPRLRSPPANRSPQNKKPPSSLTEAFCLATLAVHKAAAPTATQLPHRITNITTNQQSLFLIQRHCAPWRRGSFADRHGDICWLAAANHLHLDIRAGLQLRDGIKQRRCIRDHLIVD